jgi:hypothetical protein
VPSNPKVADAFGGVFGLPTTVLVGRDGTIRARREGTLDLPSLEQETIALLQN